MDPWLRTIIVFSIQLLVIVGVATLVESLGRVADPRLRLRFWRGVALACLALPLWGVATPAPDGPGLTHVGAVAGGSALGPVSVPAIAGTTVWWFLGAGALARFGWLCAGAARLRQLRQRSRAAFLTPDLEALRCRIAPRADVRVSSEVAQPAVFGARHPVVLLPESFFELDPEARRTVACHELLHVSRRDWPWIVAEEAARALFWFHPAVWWLVERIQESREQLVDRLVIARIPSSKRAYMRALLTFADAGSLPASATAFVRRRHLRSRLRTLAREAVMSRRRSTWTAIGLVCVMGTAVGATALALPLGRPAAEAAAVAQDVVEGPQAGVTMPRIRSEVKPQYTAEAMRARIEGAVLMTAVVRTDGLPDDIRVTRSLDSEHGLDRQAVMALEQWRFEPGRRDGKPVAVRVTVEMHFTLKK